MAKSKITKFIIFLFLIVFPFGQLLRTSAFTGNMVLVFNLLDIVAFLAVFTFFVFGGKIKISPLAKSFFSFIALAVFSFIVSIFIFKYSSLILGSFYIIRLTIYYLLFEIVRTLFAGRSDKFPLMALYVSLIFFAVFGWVQYFLYPDLTALKYLGWDDHLYRLTGTLFDPGFSSILLAFGSLISIYLYDLTKSKSYLVLFALFILSTLFTYSRAGYVTLFAGIVTFFVIKRKIKTILLVLSLIFVTILFLPRPAGQGVKLERVYSIVSRVNDYENTFKIFTKSPLIGVGYNNLCFARRIENLETDATSHSCSGADSSILLILATLGVTGLVFFANFVFKVFKESLNSKDKLLLLPVIAALFSHSQFNNSLFYPWVLGALVFIFSLI